MRPGEYKVTPTLNALIDPASYGGPPDDSIANAQPLDPYANTFITGANRTAVLGSIGGSPRRFRRRDRRRVERRDRGR